MVPRESISFYKR
jgi:hypothetical protein